MYGSNVAARCLTDIRLARFHDVVLAGGRDGRDAHDMSTVLAQVD